MPGLKECCSSSPSGKDRWEAAKRYCFGSNERNPLILSCFSNMIFSPRAVKIPFSSRLPGLSTLWLYLSRTVELTILFSLFLKITFFFVGMWRSISASGSYVWVTSAFRAFPCSEIVYTSFIIIRRLHVRLRIRIYLLVSIIPLTSGRCERVIDITSTHVFNIVNLRLFLNRNILPNGKH